MIRMFADCTSLTSFPNIALWDYSSIIDKSYMFSGCQHDFLKEKIYNNIISNEKIFSKAEIKKGGLTSIIALQFIMSDEIRKQKKLNLDLNISEFSHQFAKLNIEEDIKKITSKIKNHHFISLGIQKPDFIHEDIFLMNEKNKIEIKRSIANISINNIIIDNEENDINIFEISKNINTEKLVNFFKYISYDSNEKESKQLKLIKNLEEFNQAFDVEIEEALKESIFEFKIAHIFIIDREKDDYIMEKNKCPNRETKILFHGTKIDNAIEILSSQFRDANIHAIGIGVYFTDSLDYAWNYARKDKNGNIPKVGDYFTFVASEIYYDNTQIETVSNFNTYNIPVKKNGIRCCYRYFNFTSSSNKGKLNTNILRPIGKEYLITEKSQILPLYAVTVKRLEYLVIWRDYNFNSNNPNKYNPKIFQEIQNFHSEIKRIISREFDSKIYYVKTNEEALKLIMRKKYNKIIIITNGNNNAKDFIKIAREIIGADTIVAISTYNIPLHISWIKKMKNTIVLNGIEFHYKFLKAIMKKEIEALNELRNDIIYYYSQIIRDFGLGEFNDDLLNFSKFKKEGTYGDLSFNTIDYDKNC